MPGGCRNGTCHTHRSDGELGRCFLPVFCPVWTLLAQAQLAHPPLAPGVQLSSLPSPFPLPPLPEAMGSAAPSAFALFQASL